MSRGRTMKGVARWASLIGALVSSRPGAAGPLTVQQVRNARACLPSLADPPDRLIQFADGRYSSADVPFADMRTAAAGTLDGHQSVVAEIVWNTGGSGNWEVVVLCREENAAPECRRVYSPAPDLPDGGTMVGRIEIRDNRIYLFGDDPRHQRTNLGPLIVTTAAFQPCRLQ
jgi:hypothetical protein